MKLPALTYANVMSTLGVFIALGGTGYAVAKPPKNSVGTAELRDAAVTTGKLAPGVAVSGPRGPRGAQGPNGAIGAEGPAGPSDVIIRKHETAINFGLTAGSSVEASKFTLPAGRWAVEATVNAINYTNATIFRCSLFFGTQEFGTNQAIEVGGGAGIASIFHLIGATDSPSASQQVRVVCWHDGAITTSNELPRVERIRVIATRTSNLDVQDL